MNKYIFFTLLFLLAACAGCSQSSGGSNSFAGTGQDPVAGQTQVDDTAPAEYAPGGDAAADIEKVNARFQGAQSYKAKMTTDGPTPMVTELEFAAPNRYRIKSTGTLEILYVGRATLMKIGDEWKLMALPVDPKIGEIQAAFTQEGMKGTTGLKHAGDDVVNGRAAYVYTYRGRAPRVGVENESKLWVAKSSGLPLKLETLYKPGTVASSTVEYDFDTPVNIELPAQARRASPGYSK